MCHSTHLKLLLNPRQTSETGRPDCWHTCPWLEMLEAAGSLSYSQSAGGSPPRSHVVAGASSCLGKLALLPIHAGGGSKSDKTISLTELKCPVLGAPRLAEISKSEKCFHPK